jgi:hypothetical protein
MNESHRDPLRDALRQLPSYQPDEALWGHIREELAQAPTEEQHRETLTQGLAQLPTYRAPDWLWPRVATRLSQTRRVRTLWMSSLAAACALLIGLAVAWPPDPPVPVQASELRPTRELVLSEAQQADFLQHLTTQEQALLTCLEQQASLPESARVQWAQLREWAYQVDSLPHLADSLAARRETVVASLQAQFCE